MRGPVVRARFKIMVLIALATPAAAEPREIVGYAGVLGEWELTATVAETASRGPQELSGPVTMTHVGLCTQDGPERKIGAITLQLSASRLQATLSFAGVACSYSATLSDAYKGQMNCPDRPAVPLTLWLR
jgi:hypothetical protein